MRNVAKLAFVLCAFSPIALGFQPPSSPQTLTATGNIEIAFSPEQDVAGVVIKAINQARKQILVQAYSFTHKGIAEALIAAHQRGVDVKLIADQAQTEHIKGEKITSMAQSGVPIWMDGEHQSAHNKVIVIDVDTPEVAVITGSYNFTFAAQYKNAENLLVLRGNNKLAQLYRDNWLRHQAHAQKLR
jgi:phosphatidylserine/phosphatidylglycerophosphate/cardiolipin synthase-like enzyme